MKKEPRKDTGFKVPEGYFDNFQDRLHRRMHSQETTLPQRAGFKVPEGYFSDFDEKIRDRVLQQGGRVIRLKHYRSMYLAAAAVAAAILVLAVLLPTDNVPGFNDLARADLDYYLEHHDIELSSFEIAEVLPVDELEMEDMMEASLEEENIVEYLEVNLEDLNDLNTE